MTVSAHDVAAELRARMPGLGTKKLHKLLYYCQGHHLGVFGSALFAEPVEAWDMGPVVATLWAAEKRGAAGGRRAVLDEAALNTIGFVLHEYGSLRGDELEARTHAESPWRRADAGRRPGTGATIRPEWIRDHFRGSAEPEAPADLPAGDPPGSDGPEDTMEALLAWARAA
jgi:uncharacterized phage-associated protein